MNGENDDRGARWKRALSQPLEMWSWNHQRPAITARRPVLEVDWFGTAAGGAPPFDGLYSCCYDTGRRKNNGVLRVRNHRAWLYGPDGCEEEHHEH